MDQTLKLKLKDFSKALKGLNEALGKGKSDLVRDSVIKRFEYNFELCWKTTKVLLYEKFGKDVFSPKECFRELLRNHLLEDTDVELLLRMTNDRNEIVHSYDEKFAEKIYSRIKKDYYPILKKLNEVIRKNIK
uniref:DUF86 domain-containing protein n=1 Tax=candidate division CPR3 bacterium TaxID=2268181 RepID=A0A7C4QX69_UNCC3